MQGFESWIRIQLDMRVQSLTYGTRCPPRLQCPIFTGTDPRNQIMTFAFWEKKDSKDPVLEPNQMYFGKIPRVSSPLLTDTILLENQVALSTDQEVSIVFLGNQVTLLTDQDVSPIFLENQGMASTLRCHIFQLQKEFLPLACGISRRPLWCQVFAS